MAEIHARERSLITPVQILPTKLRPPAPAARHLRRPRVVERLSRGESSRVVVISAPAGSGKTTALAEWYDFVRQRGGRAAWVSLDEFDNGPARFVWHLLAAVDEAAPGCASEAFSRLRASPDTLVAEILSNLVQALERGAPDLTLFFDDYHEIVEPAVHGILDFLLRYGPRSTRIVLGTRRELPLSLERLSVRGQVLEFRWDELRFTVDETRDYLQRVCRLDLSEEQVRAMYHRTEGWVTALQLAAMSIATASDADLVVTSLGSIDRELAGYLLEDVLKKQPPALRRFLMRTAILDRMSAPLCEAVTGRRDAQRLIDTLVEKNLFTFALDDRRLWFRYHPLFSEFLRDRLRTEARVRVEDLYDRASTWCERSGFLPEAVRYAIAGSRFQRAGRLLEDAGRALFRHGDFKELRRAIDALPERNVRRSPTLCVLHGWALTYLGDFSAALRRIGNANALLAHSRQRSSAEGNAANRLRVETQVLRTVVGIVQDDEPGPATVPQHATGLFAREERALRGFALIARGYAERARGDLPSALSQFQEALEVSDPANSCLVNLIARMNVGLVKHFMGRTREGEESLLASLAVARERLWLRTIGSAFLRFGLAHILNDRERPGDAVDHLSEAIDVLEASDVFGFIGVALVERARARAALGDPAGAADDLARARSVAQTHGVRRAAFRADLLEARLSVRAGRLARAGECLAAAGAALDGQPIGPVLSERQEALAIEQVRLLVAQGKAAEAVRLAARAVQSASAAGRRRNMLEMLVLQSVAWSVLGNADRATAKLGQALDLAGPDGPVMPFVDTVGFTASSLRALRGDGPRRAMIGRILEAADQVPEATPAPTCRAKDDTLHRREAEILELVSQGLRNREIGKRLFLSEETVKWYLKRLFGKLTVRTRTEALAAARKKGLLA